MRRSLAWLPLPVLLVHGMNATISVHNVLIWCSALCHLTGAVFSPTPGRTVRRAVPTLAAAYTAMVGVEGDRHAVRLCSPAGAVRCGVCTRTWSNGSHT